MMHKIINADIYSALNSIKDNSIDIAITSPPYWAQRNYGFDKQIGNEETYMEFISRLVFIFDILKNKLSDKGVFFLNIGDKYLKKYGKTPLGLIPYKLAYFMQQNGWIINDTIIWHKPNHMPSSVKNRFVNSYEPVFVLSKNKDNYFTDFVKENPDYSNIISVNLQPTPYKHVAVYPEKLVSKLLSFTKIEKNFTVLDPFAGSGTTLKVINERNLSIYNKHNVRGIMIEYNPDYVRIIKERTGIYDIEIKKLNDETYEYPILREKKIEETDCFKNNKSQNIQLASVNIFDDKEGFCNALNTISSTNFIRNFPKNEIIFIGINNFDISDIYNISLIKNWIIRNKLVVKDKKWYPVFMLVHDNKTHKYNFNYKSLLLNHKTKEKADYHSKDFVGYRVENNIQKKKTKGVIIEVIDKYSNGLPKYVKVFWENKTLTKEFVINDSEEINNNIKFYQYNGYVTVKELHEFIGLENILSRNVTNYIEAKDTTKNYNGKFTDLERKNWGASPGARSSVEEEFFSVKRLYNVNQNIIADYLNYIRQEKGLSKKAFTELFPPSYKHTVGHWLRKDFGGSIPIKEDWELIEKLFDVDYDIKNYACKTSLKLQTVTKTKYKIPDDVIETKLINKLYKLNETTENISNPCTSP